MVGLRIYQQPFVFALIVRRLSVRFSCQNNFSLGTRVTEGVDWYLCETQSVVVLVPGHAGARGNKIANNLARGRSVQRFVGPNRLGGLKKNIRRKIKRWMDNQHLEMWRGPCSTKWQARELNAGPNLATRA